MALRKALIGGTAVVTGGVAGARLALFGKHHVVLTNVTGCNSQITNEMLSFKRGLLFDRFTFKTKVESEIAGMDVVAPSMDISLFNLSTVETFYHDKNEPSSRTNIKSLLPLVVTIQDSEDNVVAKYDEPVASYFNL